MPGDLATPSAFHRICTGLVPYNHTIVDPRMAHRNALLSRKMFEQAESCVVSR